MKIPRKILSIRKACTKDMDRYALTGVQFSRKADGKGHRADASDGKIAVTVRWASEDDSPAGKSVV